MLSGVKFVAREQLQPLEEKRQDESRSGGEEKKRREKYKEREQKISPDDDSSDSELDEDLRGSNKRRRRRRRSRRKSKKRYCSDEDGDDDDDSSSSCSESGSDGGGDKRSRRKKRGDKRKKKKDREMEESSDDGGGLVRNDNRDTARKEMGLEWMLKSGSSDWSNKPLQATDELEEEHPVGEAKKTNPRELNPYLKDSGSGYPDASASDVGINQLRPSSFVGDGGASWRLKALKRAKEQAAREGRKIDDVVEERWGSLGQLAASVAGRRAAPTHAHLHAIKDRKRGVSGNADTVETDGLKEDGQKVRHEGRDYLRNVSSRNPEMRKPKSDSLHWKKNKGHNIASEENSLVSEVISNLNKFGNDGSFMESFARLQNDTGVSTTSSHAIGATNDHREENLLPSKDEESANPLLVNEKELSANQLSAKIVKLRMKGKHEEAEKLSKEMEAMIQRQDTTTKYKTQESKGNINRHIQRKAISESKKAEDDADLHLAQQIMQNRRYSMSGRADDEYDYDDAPRKKHKRKQEMIPEGRTNSIIAKRILIQQERCQFCFENPSRPKHLVISIANFTYMILPQWQPVVPGHCCILPMQHESATRTVDNNVWGEIRNFKKCLLRMFGRQDKDVIFLETVIGLANQRRHCLLDCVPIPFDIAKEAPMYFKKAIDEAEDEWGQHEMKKLIQTNGNLRHVIPENFSYFHVEFGLDRGFAHVIDEDSNFKSSFGLNVIRGLLRLPEEDMYRRRRHETVEKQMQAAASFAKEWELFDWTKELD